MIPASNQQHKIWLSLSAVLLIVFFVYIPVLNNQFVNWDDDIHVTQNPFLSPLSWQRVGEIFTTTINYIYLPLTTLSWAVEYHFVGANPFVFHLTNVLLHLVVVGLVFFFALEIGLPLLAATIAALIFGIHPIHVESVAWITERKDVLYAAFYMSALCVYARYLKKISPQPGMMPTRSQSWYFLSVPLLGFLSILAKPMALSLPLILFLIDWYWKRPFSKRSLFEKVLVASVLAPIAWMTFVLHHNTIVTQNLMTTVLTWLWTSTFPLRKFFNPQDLTIFYGVALPVDLKNPEFSLALWIFIGVVVSALVLRRSRWYLFALAFYFLSTFFLSRADSQLGISQVADRFMYLPSLGFCLWMGSVVERDMSYFKKNVWAKAGSILFCLTIAAFWGMRTIQQIKVWQTGTTLWAHQLKTQPQILQPLVHTKMAEALIEEKPAGWEEKVLQHLQLALKRQPDYASAEYYVGIIYKEKREWLLAQQAFQRTLELAPDRFDAYYELGVIAAINGRAQEAVVDFQHAVNCRPQYPGMVWKIINFEEGMIKSSINVPLYQRHREQLLQYLQLLAAEGIIIDRPDK